MLRAAALHVLRDTAAPLLWPLPSIFCRPCSSCCEAMPPGLETASALLGEFRRLEAELHQYILDYSAQREDEVGAEDRWRIQLNKRLRARWQRRSA